MRVSNYHHGGQARKVGDKIANGHSAHVSFGDSHQGQDPGLTAERVLKLSR